MRVERDIIQTPTCQVALAALAAGLSVLPICPDGSKQPDVPGWKIYQQIPPTIEKVQAWFRYPERGLALITGYGGLIALDFDDPGAFDAWVKGIRHDAHRWALYRYVSEGYEEKTPKGGRHILFLCPEVFAVQRRPGNQKLALRPLPPPQRYKTLAETREYGGVIIIDPSRGSVHPSGRPYIRLRGNVSTIRTISAAEREHLYASVRMLDEVPVHPNVEPARVFQPGASRSFPSSVPGERPGDLFMADPANTWESLLAGWDISEPSLNPGGYLERYLRHPGKVGPNPNVTLNADGTDRLFCFSPSVGLPMDCYLSRFDFYVHWYWGGNYTAAARALAEKGYTNRKQ